MRKEGARQEIHADSYVCTVGGLPILEALPTLAAEPAPRFMGGALAGEAVLVPEDFSLLPESFGIAARAAMLV